MSTPLLDADKEPQKHIGLLREAAKKVPPLVAGPLRGGGGGKGWAIKEKRTFFETFLLFCCHLKIKIILL